ncbi:sigma 54-interacting transcriptional regulator [Clostridium sp.]|uniref:sigma-54 interaction domain-containing protein n=1 Tax=Clostridium sp. TaxID=1506 RepID=UPI002FC7384D
MVDTKNDIIQDSEPINCETYKKRQADALAIANSISDGIYIMDSFGRVTAINKAFVEITGIKDIDIVGKYMQDVWNNMVIATETPFIEIEPEDKVHALDILSAGRKKVLKTRKPYAIALTVLQEKKPISILTTVDRTNKRILVTGTPFYDGEGNITQVITIIKDLTELFDLREKLEEAEKDKRKYISELKNLKKDIKENQIYKDLVSQSGSMDRVIELIEYISKTDVTVLITGETGVGKEVVARTIFKNSKRAKGPYIKVNCAAIPETLLESELFGYEKGAFTGAQQKEKLGLFELANNGTILLDEIGEIPLKLQSKLLRVLQEKEIKRIGGVSTINIDVRVIAATNLNLEEQVKKGNFREDLYYRLNVVPIVIPPLRDRKEDVSLLAYNFLEKFNKLYGKAKDFDITAIEMLEGFNWPGNVRELENSIERLVVIGDEKLITRSNIVNILGKDKFSSINTENIQGTLKDAVEQLERNIIEKTLRKCGSTYKAAEVLGITQSTVVRKAKALGITEW